MLGRLIGLALFLIVVAAVAAIQLTSLGESIGPLGPVQQITVTGYVGSEKEGLLRDPEVQRLLRDRHAIDIAFTTVDSIEMVRQDTADLDFLWPASQVALDLFQERQGKIVKASNIFNSPLVLYSWPEVVDALATAGLVEQVGDVAYVDLAALVRLNDEGKQWRDLGLGGLRGRVAVVSTDPARSSSGSAFAALVAGMYLGGHVADPTTIESVLPQTQAYYRRLGYLWPSSKNLFEQYLKSGRGAYPIIADYESLLIEYGVENRGAIDRLRSKIRVLYPRPTSWSTHPLIALSPKGVRLLDALQDRDIHRLAWERHGFRTGLLEVHDDPTVLEPFGMPEDVESSLPLPKPSVVEQIIRTLS